MRSSIRNFLEDEEHALTVLIAGSVAIMAAGLVVAACAIYFMK
jgi:hypothetical protein